MTWQEEVIGKVARKQDALYPGAFSNWTRAHLAMPLELINLLERACQKRNVNRSTYMRRAIAVLLAHDLNIPIRVVLSHSPTPGPYRSLKFTRGRIDTGEGIESWCPHPGCDGSHLS